MNPVTNTLYLSTVDEYDAEVPGLPGQGDIYTFADTLPINDAVVQNNCAIAINPVTNKVYIARDVQDMALFDAATGAVTRLPLTGEGVDVNPITNKIYVSNAPSPRESICSTCVVSSNTLTVIDGATDSIEAVVTVGAFASTVIVNPITNKIYVNGDTMFVIDGATNIATPLPVTGTCGYEHGFGDFLAPITCSYTFTVDSVTNKVYVADGSANLTVIDGNTNIASIIPGSGGTNIALNPATDELFVFNLNAFNPDGPVSTDPPSFVSDTATIANPRTQPNSLTTTITPLPGNVTTTSTPTFRFTAASSTSTPPNAVFYQVDTWEKTWLRASGINPSFTGTVPALLPGVHIVYAYAQGGSSSSPVTGSIQSYVFLVTPPNVPLPLRVSSTPLIYSRSTSGSFYYYYSSNTFNSTYTVTNTTTQPIAGDIQLVLTGSGASYYYSGNPSVANLNGFYQGSPYVTIPNTTLAPGASVSVDVMFNDPYDTTPVVYAGGLSYTP
jgi:hypothetical protein